MKDEHWLIVDTETNGLIQPVYVVEIAAQRMCGWDPVGPPFQALLNHDVPIDPGAEAVHGYSREHLRRHGGDPRQVHQAFHDYAGSLPLVAYNLSFDWGRVLAPEYQRLGVPVSGTKGFCALTLARRVIEETPNHRLETLKWHFQLGDERSHRGLNDVNTTVRLFQQVFRERLEAAGIVGFAAVSRFSRRTPVARCRAELRQPPPAAQEQP